jgi:hypothetical protein
MQTEIARLQFAVPAEEATKRERARIDASLSRWKINMAVVVGVTAIGLALLEPQCRVWLLSANVVSVIMLNVLGD